MTNKKKFYVPGNYVRLYAGNQAFLSLIDAKIFASIHDYRIINIAVAEVEFLEKLAIEKKFIVPNILPGYSFGKSLVFDGKVWQYSHIKNSSNI